VSGIHALDAKDADVPLFQACDEVSDSQLAKVDSGQIEHPPACRQKTRANGQELHRQPAIGTTGQ
jgi:hypothetical protein